MRIRLLPRRIDFYILNEVLGPFLGGILFFCFVFLMFQALRLADFFIIHGVSAPILAEMTALLLLSFMPTAVPIAFLIGTLVGFGRLSADSEIVAMKANGISIWRLAAPVSVLAVLVMFVSLGLNMQWVPQGDRLFKSTLIRVSNTKVVTSIKEGTFTSGFFDLLIFADKVDAENNKLYRVFIYDEREPKNPMTVIAQEGELVPVKSSTQIGTSLQLQLFRGSIHSNDAETATYQKIDFEKYGLFLKIDEGADNATIKPRMIPHDELQALINKHEPGHAYRRELEAELWRRYSVALTPILFVFLGIGFGTVRTRAVRASAALIALGVIMLYYAIQATATVAIQKSGLPPALGMQLPNIILAVLGWKSFKSAAW